MKNVNLGTIAGVVTDKDVLVFSNYSFNGLFEYDLTSNTMKFISAFEGMLACQDLLHLDALLYCGEVVFCPYSDVYLRIYNPNEHILDSYLIPEIFRANGFYRGNIVNGKLIIVNYDYRIIQFDLEKREFEDRQDLSAALIRVCSSHSGQASVTVNDKKIFISDIGFSGFVELDPLDMKMNQYNLKKGFENICYVKPYENGYWILCANRQDVLFWDRNDKYYSYLSDGIDWMECYRDEYYPFDRVYTQNQIMVSSYYSVYPYLIDKEAMRLKRFFSLPEGFEIIKDFGFGRCFGSTINYDNKIVVAPVKGNMIVIFDVSSNKVESHRFDIEDLDMTEYLRDTISKDGMAREGKMTDLESFIQVIL